MERETRKVKTGCFGTLVSHPRSPAMSLFGRAHASAVYAMALCLCVCVYHKSVFYENGSMDWAAWFLACRLFRSILHCVVRTFRKLHNKGILLSGSLPKTLDLEKFCHVKKIVATVRAANKDGRLSSFIYRTQDGRPAASRLLTVDAIDTPYSLGSNSITLFCCGFGVQQIHHKSCSAYTSVDCNTNIAHSVGGSWVSCNQSSFINGMTERRPKYTKVYTYNRNSSRNSMSNICVCKAFVWWNRSQTSVWCVMAVVMNVM